METVTSTLTSAIKQLLQQQQEVQPQTSSSAALSNTQQHNEKQVIDITRAHIQHKRQIQTILEVHTAQRARYLSRYWDQTFIKLYHENEITLEQLVEFTRGTVAVGYGDMIALDLAVEDRRWHTVENILERNGRNLFYSCCRNMNDGRQNYNNYNTQQGNYHNTRGRGDGYGRGRGNYNNNNFHRGGW